MATKKATNPVYDLGTALSIPMLQEAVTRTIELPIKLLIPIGTRMMMLGLGDIALPGQVNSMFLFYEVVSCFAYSIMQELWSRLLCVATCLSTSGVEPISKRPRPHCSRPAYLSASTCSRSTSWRRSDRLPFEGMVVPRCS